MSKEWNYDMILHPVLPNDIMELGDGTYGGITEALTTVLHLTDAELGKLMRAKVLQSVDLSWDGRNSLVRYLENTNPTLLQTLRAAQKEAVGTTVTMKGSIQPDVGRVYQNQGGGTFLCVGYENGNAVMRNTISGWQFTAHGCRRFEDGSIEWDYSTGGTFPNGQEQSGQKLEHLLESASRTAAEANSQRSADAVQRRMEQELS